MSIDIVIAWRHNQAPCLALKGQNEQRRDDMQDTAGITHLFRSSRGVGIGSSRGLQGPRALTAFEASAAGRLLNTLCTAPDTA